MVMKPKDVIPAIVRIDKWLDDNVSEEYKAQPLAQDWARVAKMTEELGEAIDAFIGLTGQNPRKGYYGTRDDLLDELADAALASILAIQHFTKDEAETVVILITRLAYRLSKIPEGE